MVPLSDQGNETKRRARNLPEILLLDSPDGKPTDGGSSPAGLTGPFSLRSAVWLRTAQSSLITSPFLTLRNRRPAGGGSKGIKGAGTHRQRCCHKQEGGVLQGWVMAWTSEIPCRWIVLFHNKYSLQSHYVIKQMIVLFPFAVSLRANVWFKVNFFFGWGKNVASFFLHNAKYAEYATLQCFNCTYFRILTFKQQGKINQ